MFKYFFLLASFLCCNCGWCHIGSINTVFDMDSGPYPVRVIITPTVGIPGTVDVVVKSLDEKGALITSVTALPVRSDVDPDNQPVPFKLEPVGSGIFSGPVFLNSIGPYQMIIQLDGNNGKIKVSVPFDATLMTAPYMNPFFLMFIILGVSFSLLILIVAIHKIFKEGHLSAGQTPSSQDRRRGYLAYLGMAVVILGTSLYLYNLGSVQLRSLYKKKFHPPTLQIKIESVDDNQLLFLTIQPNDQWREALPQNPLEDGYFPIDQRLDTHLVPDHGKFMHLFMIDIENKKAIAHLHPEKIGDSQFETLLPNLPPGTYNIFADVTNESGFALTMTSTITLPSKNAPQASEAIKKDPDDSMWMSSEKSPYRVTMTEPKSFKANQDVTMIFEVVDEKGKPVDLEPYMGMLSHAAIVNEDGTTFAHIHPNGTSSMAAIHLFAQKNHENSMQMIPKEQSIIRLPFVFPASGKYYLWVQYKVNNKVETAPFIINVN